MKQNHSNFDLFLAAARRGRRPAAPPSSFGFATRVAARWVGRAHDPLELWERLARRFAFAAGVAAVLIMVLNFQAPPGNPLVDFAAEAEGTENFL